MSGRARPVERTLILFGKWTVTKNAKLEFEVRRGSRKIQSMAFTAECVLADKNKVLLRMKRDTGSKDLGVTLKLSRNIFKGAGEIFLELKGSKQGGSVYAGSGMRW